jgi:hypothetical protein
MFACSIEYDACGVNQMQIMSAYSALASIVDCDDDDDDARIAAPSP